MLLGNTRKAFFVLLVVGSVFLHDLQEARSQSLPTFSGKYVGSSADAITMFAGTVTPRGFLRDIQFGAILSGCTVEIPGSPTETMDRYTNISKAETPLVRLGRNGRFTSEFDLIDSSRVDFKDARVELSGQIRGGRGRMNLTISFAKRYEDGSQQTCLGNVTILISRARTRELR